MDDILQKRITAIQKNVEDKITASMIEDLYEITIKKNIRTISDNLDTYNVYDKNTGNLLFPKLYSWQIDDLFKNIGYSISIFLQKSAPEDKDIQSINESIKQLEIEQALYEHEHYKICAICGLKYNSKYQAHYHF